MKKRVNIYLETLNQDKLHDVQYLYRKEKKKKLSLSEIVNRVFREISVVKLTKMMNGE